MVNATVDSNEVLIGDIVNLKLSARHDEGIIFQFPAFPEKISDFEVLNISELDSISEENGQLLESQTFQISVYDSGIYEIESIPLPYQREGSTTVDTAFSNSIFVAVNTLPVDTAQPIKAIKGPLAIPLTFRELLPYIAGGIGLLLILGLAIFLYLRKSKKIEPIIIRRPKLPPHVIARQKLDALEAEKLWQKEEVKLYYVRLSEIVREYVELRFTILALESTTYEIMCELRNKEISKEANAILSELLETSDLAKFAKYKPMPDENMKAMEQAHEFVQLTKIAVAIQKQEIEPVKKLVENN